MLGVVRGLKWRINWKGRRKMKWTRELFGRNSWHHKDFGIRTLPYSYDSDRI